MILESNSYHSFFSAFPHNSPNMGLSPFLGTLNTGGSLPDLTNLHYSAPLPASLDTGNPLFGGMSMGNSVGNLPAAMTHLGIRSSSGKCPCSVAPCHVHWGLPHRWCPARRPGSGVGTSPVLVAPDPAAMLLWRPNVC